MAEHNYKWKRYWSTRDAHINISSDGFLLDPGENFISKSVNPELLTIEDLINQPCVVLLGEPGSGKTTELHNFSKLTIDTLSNPSDKVKNINLNTYSSDFYLVKEIFQSDDFISWVHGEGNLFLFVDSLDEGMLSITKITNIISNELIKIPTGRLFFRIACRSLDWPSSFESSLCAVWRKENVNILELAPLRKQDVVAAAKQNNLDGNKFLEQIIDKDVVPLAIKPITLSFLLKTYNQKQILPHSRKELYDIGCKNLCGEINQSRVDSKQTGKLSTPERMVIAGRIAAIMLLTNSNEVSLNPDLGDNEDSVICVDNIAGYSEEINGINITVSRSEILETLSSALFSFRSDVSYGFVHHTYAEFLAAWYVNHRRLKITQVTELLTQSFDGFGKIIPQLHEMAAWLTSYSDSFQNYVLINDPFVLLLSDTSNLGENQRSKLVEKIFSLYEKGQILDRQLDFHRIFKKLNHSNIDNQLLEYISNKQKLLSARKIAVEIAIACEAKSLQANLVDQALDTTENIQLRIVTAYAIQQIGDTDVKRKLLPLAFSQLGDDPDDELKGIGLSVVWPEIINTKQLFNVLTPQKDKSLFGTYQNFLSNLRYDLSNVDLIEALDWAKEKTKHETVPSEFEEIIDSLIIKAWNEIGCEEILLRLSETIYGRILNLKPIIVESSYLNPKQLISFHNSYKANSIGRHALLLSIIDRMNKNKIQDYALLTFHFNDLILQDDFLWIISQISPTNHDDLNILLADLAEQIINREDQYHLEQAYKTMGSISVLYEYFHNIFGPIELNSPMALRLRKNHEYSLRQSKNEIIEIPYENQIQELLGRFDSGEMDAWWKLNRNISTSDGKSVNDFYCDITSTPGWIKSNDALHTRVIESAKIYLEKGDPETDKWMCTDSYYFAALSGYRALYLLQLTNPKFIFQLENVHLAKWAPIVISFSSFIADNNLVIHSQLLETFYQRFPQVTIDILDKLIDKENKKSKNIFILEHIFKIIDGKLADFLIDKAISESMTADSCRTIIFLLLKSKIRQAIDLCITNIPDLGSTDMRSKEKAVDSIYGLIMFVPEVGWNLFLSKLDEYSELLKEVVLKLSRLTRREELKIVDFLNEDKLYRFSKWLFESFPPEEDQNDIQGKFHTITPRQELAGWRDSIVVDIANIGSYEAYEVLKKLSLDFPNVYWIKWKIKDSEIAYRRKTWKPPTSADLFQLLMNTNIRLVQNGNQLMEVVIESLDRLQQSLHGETPASQFLWDKVSANKYQPKEENKLSDYIKIYLNNDLTERGIISNREVEIRPRMAPKTGQNTDIHIDALSKSLCNEKFEKLSLIIETKCIWNIELLTGIKDQLADRYLYQNPSQIGIYLVGWYLCQSWDKNDYRYDRCKKLIKSELELALNEQAYDLSIHGIVIRPYILDISL